MFFKLLLSICFSMALVLVNGQEELSVDQCGKTFECYRNPIDCTSSDTCDMLVMHQFHSSSNTVEVQMSTKSGSSYIGWGKSDHDRTKQMAGAKGVVCLYNGASVELKSFHATGNDASDLKSLPSGYSSVSTARSSKNSIICKFTRTVTVPSGSEDLMFDVSTPLYMLYAYGLFNSNSGSIQYHTGRIYSQNTVSIVTGEKELSVEECGVSMKCFRRPSNCTSSDTCDILVMYKHVPSSNVIEASVSTRSANGYIGWAQNNQDQQMAGAKGVVCYYNGTRVLLESFNATKNGPPSLVTLPSGFSSVKTYRTDNNSIVCKFSRTVNVPSGSEDLMYDVSKPLYMLYAFGAVNNGAIWYHGNKTKRIMSDAPLQIVSVSGEQELSVEECGVSMKCFKIPNNCTSSDTCDILVMYKHVPSSNVIEASVSTRSANGYIGWAQNNQDQQMVGSKGVVCYYNGNSVLLESFNFNATKNGPPSLVTLPSGFSSVKTYRTDNNSIVCKFSRMVNVPIGSEDLMYDVSKPLYMLYAFGAVNNGAIGYHKTNRIMSDAPLQIAPTQESRISIPSDCKDDATCDAVVKFSYDKSKDKVTFTLITKHVWIASAQKPKPSGNEDGMAKIMHCHLDANPGGKIFKVEEKDNKMQVNIKGQYCIRGGNFIGSLDGSSLSRNSAPQFTSAEGADLTDTIVKTENQLTTCTYTRPVTPTPANKYLHDLKNKMLAVIAFGDQKSGNTPQRHGTNQRDITRAEIDFLTADGNIEKDKELTVEECEVSMKCFKSPSNCTSSDTCDILVMYKHVPSSNVIEASVSTRSANGYIGWAQNNQDQKMVGSKGVVCYYNGNSVLLESFNFNATKNGPPSLVTLPSGFSSVKTYRTDNNSIVCKFSRMVNVPSGSEDLMYDVSKPLYMLYAFGAVNNGEIGYHKTNRIMSDAPLQIAPTQESRISIPSDCKDDATCDAVVKFSYDKSKDKVTFTLITKHVWIASAQKPKPSGNEDGMVNIKGQYCISGGNFVGSLDGSSLSGNNAPQFTSAEGADLTDTIVKTENQLTTCTYTRPVTPNPANKYLHDLKNKMLAVIAFGDSKSGNTPKQHGNNQRLISRAEIDFLKAVGNIALPVSEFSLSNNVIAHGVLMILAWIFFSTIGIFMARYMREFTKDKKIFDKQAWFRFHQLCMVTCVILVIISFIIILVEKKGWQDSAGRHGTLGVITVVLALIQPIMAAFRPDPDAERRFIFNWAHRTVGVGAWVIAGVCITLAFKDHLDKDHIPMIVFIAVSVGLFVLLDITRCLTSSNSGNADIQYNTKGGASVEMKNTSAGENETYNKLSVIWCLLVFCFSVAMAAYHIYIVGSLKGESHDH